MKVEGLNGAGAAKNQKPIDRVEKLEKEIANLSMATRISQMLLKQVMEQLETLKKETNSNTGMLNDFQYRVLALQKTLNVNVDAIAAEADALKLVDWNSASDKDDATQNFIHSNKVESDADVVIITSTVPGSDNGGIFRSKSVLADTRNKELIDALVGKSVGDKVEVTLNEEKHVVELLGVRQFPKTEATPAAT